MMSKTVHSTSTNFTSRTNVDWKHWIYISTQMRETAKQTGSVQISAVSDTYIYSLARLQNSCAAISSDDALTYFDPSTLAVKHQPMNNNAGLTCLTASSDGKGALVAGRDGVVRCWDERARSAGLEFRNRKPRRPVASYVPCH